MADAVFGAAGEIWAMIVGRTHGSRTISRGRVRARCRRGRVMGRGKLAAAIWMPSLALAGYFAWRHFVR
jgi:hypothetical protein